MNKELQDLAWSLLPKAFKEEVKYEYRRVATKVIKSNYDLGLMNAHEGMYGHHNLTSDAEGEEMLTVPRKDIVELYREVQKTTSQCKGTELATQAIGIRNVIWSFFGSKCLPDKLNEDNFAKSEPKPFKYKVGQKVILHFYGGEVSTITEAFNDGGVWNKYKVKALPTRVWNENELDPYEEPKPAEPKFKRGDMVKYKRTGKKKVVLCTDKYGRYLVALPNMQSLIHVDESDLEPYTEPKEECRNLSQNIANCDKYPTFVQKTQPDFDHSRLNIAAMVMQGILANPNTDTEFVRATGLNRINCGKAEYIASRALRYADALMNEAEKGGDQ